MSGTSTVRADLSVTETTHTIDAVVTLSTIEAKVTFPTPTVEPTTPTEDLPSEVIAEALTTGVTFLRPVDGEWAIEVTVTGETATVIAFVTVGDKQDADLAVAEYLDGLSRYWESMRQDDDT